MPAKDNSVTTKNLPAELSNGMSKDATIKDLRRRMKESVLFSNAGFYFSGKLGRRRRRKPKIGTVPRLATPATPVLTTPLYLERQRQARSRKPKKRNQ
jgi:hypothetical protein